MKTTKKEKIEALALAAQRAPDIETARPLLASLITVIHKRTKKRK